MPDGSFHLILCRNLVFTYFEPALQQEIFRGIIQRLVAGGIFLIGRRESLPDGWSSHLKNNHTTRSPKLKKVTTTPTIAIATPATENPIKRRISLGMLVGFVLKAIAAGCETLPIAPWDRKPQPRVGRRGNYLDIRLHNLTFHGIFWLR